MNRPSTFAVCSHDNSPDASVIKMVTFKGPKEALDHLKTLSGQHYDGYIVPNTAAERDAFPCRNKIGPLRADDSNHWGYRFKVPNTTDVYALWIEKQEVGEGYRTLKEDFQEEWVAEWVKRCDCDYAVHSQAQTERDQAHSGRWDEDKGDFVFGEELEDEAGEQETAAGHVVEDSEQKDVEEKEGEEKDGEQKDGEQKDILSVGQQKDVALRRRRLWPLEATVQLRPSVILCTE
ncbi:hypothetical protein Q7P35_012335 [Cladosporium inversicolor]